MSWRYQCERCREEFLVSATADESLAARTPCPLCGGRVRQKVRPLLALVVAVLLFWALVVSSIYWVPRAWIKHPGPAGELRTSEAFDDEER